MSESVSGKAPSHMHDVTIVVKTFERLDSLKKLLVSIRRYYPSIPILVADDSRKPATQEITGEFSHLEYIPLRFDVGLSAGRNALLKRIKTKYFVLCDDDFIFDERSKLENFKKILDETDVELVGGYFNDVTEKEDFSMTRLYAGDLVLDSLKNMHMVVINPTQPFVRCDIVPNWFMADTEAVRRKTGGWDPKLKVEEHTDFFWRAKQAGLKVAFTPDVNVKHTVARDKKYLFFRDTRKNRYHRLFFKKAGIRSFTDIWETITWEEIQPTFIGLIYEEYLPWYIIKRCEILNQSIRTKISDCQTWWASFTLKMKQRYENFGKRNYKNG